MDKIAKSRAPQAFTIGALVALVAFAFFLRVEFIAIYGGGSDYLRWATANFFGAITPQYLTGASSILSGEPYSLVGYPPGYSLFIAAAKIFGITGLQQLRLLQAFLDSFTVVGIYWLLQRLGSSRGFALLGGGVYAFFGEWVAGSTFLLAEWMSPALIVWLLVLIIAAIEKKTVWLWGFVGLLIAFGALTRPDLFLLIIPAVGCALGLWKWPQKRTRTIGLATLILSFVLPIGSWGLYNRIHQNHWIFTSTSGGAGLWEGLADIPNNRGFVLSDKATADMLASHGLIWHSVAADQYLKSKYWKVLIEYPAYVLKAAIWRWQQIAFKTDIAVWSNMYYGAQQAIRNYFEVAGIWVWIVAMLLAWRQPVVILVAGLPLLYAFFSVGLVHYEPRYVRYAHLSYLFAPFILLSIFQRALPQTLKHRLLGMLEFGAIAAYFYCTVLYAHTFHITAQIAALPAKAADGQLTQLFRLSDMRFQQVVKNKMTRGADGTVTLQTDESTFAYQLVSEIPLGKVRFLYVPFQARLIHGGFGIGLLGPNQRWLAQKAYATAGQVDGYIGLKLTGQQGVTLVITNNCKTPCTSALKLEHLGVYVEK